MKFQLDIQLQKTVAHCAGNISVLLLILLSVFFTSTSYGGTSAYELLSADERAWLEKHQQRLVLAVETGYAPFVFIDSKGQPAGLAQDYVRLIEAKLGVQFNQKRFASLDEIFQKVRGGEVQIVNAITNTPTRAKFLFISEPFISVPNVIIMRNDRTGKMAEYDLQGLKVSLVKSYAITEHMENRGLKLITDFVPDDLSALLNVSFGRSDAAVIDLATATYLISHKGITNLRVAGEVTYDIRLSLGVPINEPVLYGILQKGLSAITNAERQEIKNRWISASKQQSIFKDRQFWMVLGSVLAVSSAIFVIILLWNHTLRRQIVLRKQAEMDARISEERLKEAQRISQIGNWELNLINNKLLWSDEIFSLFEIDPKKFPATYDGFLNAIHPEDRDMVNMAYTRSLKNREPYEVTHRLLMPDGRIKWVTERCHSDFDADKKPIRSIGTIQDITKLKQAEIELTRYKNHLEEEVKIRTADLILARDVAESANRAKSTFLTSMSHELRTPLNAILGFSSLMRRDKQLRPEQRANLDIINRSGEHLLTLINDILEMSKIEAGKLQLNITPLDLSALVRNVTDMMELRAREKGLQLLIEQSSALPSVIMADEVRLRQILINLLGNAIKFTEQGAVTLRMGTKQNAHVHLIFEIEDSGSGLSAEDQQRLFQPFMQFGKQPGDNKGTGLGLSITRQYVQMMGGSINVESTLGKGSLFRVDLPLNEVKAAEPLPPQKTEKSEVIGLATDQPLYRILIVETQLESQLLLSQLMQHIGFEVKVAEDAKQGVTLFQSWHPHLIWMDRQMPDMEGIEATKAIRALPGGKEVKIVAVTASIEQQDEMLAAGMDDFVRKPYRFNEIYECLTRQLGVKYAYAETPTKAESASAPLTADMMAVLPEKLRHELKAALESLIAEQIGAVLEQVKPYDATLYQTLSRLVDNYDVPSILKVLKTNEAAAPTAN